MKSCGIKTKETKNIKNVSNVKNVYNFAAAMEERKRQIIGNALEIYLKYGIKSVTMDEMSRQLGISKKTLYQFVKDKNELVEECLLFMHDKECDVIEKIYGKNMDAIEEILEVTQFIIAELRSVHPSIFFDMAKYHPNALKLMHNHKYDVVCGTVIDNLNRGIEQGLYRENLNVEVISHMYMGFIDLIIGGEILVNTGVSAEEAYSEFFRYHIRGIATDKGLKHLKKFISSDEKL